MDIEGLTAAQQAYVKSQLSDLNRDGVDEEMTVKSYIVPGIGDPGDVAYGEKL